jgi:hypothetical protein
MIFVPVRQIFAAGGAIFSQHLQIDPASSFFSAIRLATAPAGVNSHGPGNDPGDEND